MARRVRGGARRFRVTRRGPVCVDVHFDEIPNSGGKDWEAWVLLQSDEHWDHPRCDRSLYREHLEEAKARGALVLKFGDLFCGMQLPQDKRAAKGDTRDEHNRPNYLDLLVKDAIEWHRPFAPYIGAALLGNHELDLQRMASTNLVDRFCAGMREHGGAAVACGYRCWFRFFFARGPWRTSKTLYGHHGSGGNSPVTRGMLKVGRRASVTPDADLFVTGHIHQELDIPFARRRLRKDGTEIEDEQLHIQLGTYKRAMEDQPVSWEHVKEFAPSNYGMRWLRFHLRKDAIACDVRRS